MEFGQGDPASYLFNIETGQREVAATFPACRSRRASRRTASASSWSLQGRQFNLFVMDLRSKTIRA
jgi:hypothetical protein